MWTRASRDPVIGAPKKVLRIFLAPVMAGVKAETASITGFLLSLAGHSPARSAGMTSTCVAV